MVNFLKKYKAFGIGLVIVIAMFLLLEYIGFIIIPEDVPIEIAFVITFWWLLISIPIHNLGYLKKNKKTVFKVVALVFLFFTAFIIDGLMGVADNPITFALLLSFWLGFVYVLVPSFVTKYWKLIALFYGPIFFYYLYIRLFSGDLEAYLKIKEGMSFFYFFIPIPILFVLWAFEQWKWLKNLKAEKSQSELALLRTQINPHFFFNTLNNLYALTVKNSEQAPEVILKLSDMMRYTIYEGEKEYVAIKDEIEYLKNYIELHKIRYKKTVEFQFDHDIDGSLTIAPLLYIILLENAFKHGVETLTEDAYIHINLSSDDDFISFIIENNFDPKEIGAAPGIGLTNLKRRLSLIYPKKHELILDRQENTYKATLKIARHV